MKKYLLLTLVATVCAAIYAGCSSNVQPIEPIHRVVMWVPDDPASQPSTSPTTMVAAGEPIPELAPLLANTGQLPVASAATKAATQPTTRPKKHSAATQTASTKPAATESASTESASTQVAETQDASTESASTQVAETQDASTESASTQTAQTQGAGTQSASTQPSHPTTVATTRPSHHGEHLVVKVIDPNQTSRYIYHASYDNIWQQATKLLVDNGFSLDRKDYRLGILTTQPLPSAQWVEFWKPQQTTFKNALENTVNMQQRSVRISISPVPDKPEFYEIAIQVLVERQNNPIVSLGGPVFVEGSGFGKSQVSLRSDYAPVVTKDIGPTWYLIGHDQQLEHKLLSELFKHI